MAVIGNAPFQGLVSGGNIIDASIEGVDLSTSAIAARLGYTPVDPGAAVFSANPTISSGTANGIAYLNGSKVVTTGSNLTFDGTQYQKLTTVTYSDGGFVNARTTLSGGTFNTYDFVEGTTVTGYLRNYGSIFGSNKDNQLHLWNTQNAPLVFGTNNAERMRLTNIGLGVGLGGGNPTAALDVHSGTANSKAAYISSFSSYTADHGPMLVFRNGTGSEELAGIKGAFAQSSQGNYGYLSLLTRTSDALGITEKVRITSNGNLGVGTSSPSYLIHAVGSGEDKAEIQAQNISTAGNSRGNLRVKSATSTYGGGVMMTNATDSAYPTSALCLYNYDNQPLIFGTNNTERMRIASNGSVSIGTSSSFGSAALHISKSASISATDFIYSSAPTAVIQTPASGALGFSSLMFRASTASNAYTAASLELAPVTDYRGAFVATYSADGSGGYFAVNQFHPSNAATYERLRISNTGNVGVGTTTPGGDMSWASPVLDIQGTRGSLVLRTTSSSGIATLRFKGPDANANDDWHINMGAGTNSTIQFSPKAGGGNVGLVLRNDGFVGIGTASPATKLHVFAIDTSANRTATLNAVTITAESGQLPYNGFGPSIVFAARAYNSGIVDSTRITSEINNNSVDNFGGSIGFDVTPTIGSGFSRALTIKYNGTVIAKNPIVVGSGMTGENGAAIAAPYSMVLPIYTYYTGSTYMNYAARLCKFPKNGADSRFVATIYSRGDYNYSYMVAETHLDVAVWSNSPNVYDFWARETSVMTDVRFALDSEGYLWYHFPQLWSQDHVMVIHRMYNADLSITNTTFHNSTLAWKLVAAGTQYNEENSWGS
jgi:hypothetical protein